MARPHPLCKLLLCEPELRATHDHEPCDAFVGCQSLLGGAVLRVSTPAATRSLSGTRSDGTRGAGAHGRILPILIRSAKLRECKPTAHRGRQLGADCVSQHPSAS